jgi:HPr kinase/phosphorylase
VQHFLQQPIAGCLFTNNLHPPQVFLDMANHHQIAVLLTETPYHTVLPHITALLSYTFAHKHHVHGVLVEVHSMGILITGSSGIGKSETALELLSRGHRLVADDLVEIRKINSQSLIGSRNNYLKNKHFLEIRGVGILDINQLFGIKACLDKREIDLVIHLEEYIDGQMYERLGINHAKTELLAVTLPTMSVPVKPGRNIPIILETAALHFRNQRTLHGYPQHLLQKLV